MFSRTDSPSAIEFGVAVARDEADAVPDRVVRAREVEPLAAEADRAAIERQQAEQRPADRLLAGAAQADETDDLARLDREVERPDAAGDDARKAQQRLASPAAAAGRTRPRAAGR